MKAMRIIYLSLIGTFLWSCGNTNSQYEHEKPDSLNTRETSLSTMTEETNYSKSAPYISVYNALLENHPMPAATYVPEWSTWVAEGDLPPSPDEYENAQSYEQESMTSLKIDSKNGSVETTLISTGGGRLEAKVYQLSDKNLFLFLYHEGFDPIDRQVKASMITYKDGVITEEKAGISLTGFFKDVTEDELDIFKKHPAFFSPDYNYNPASQILDITVNKYLTLMCMEGTNQLDITKEDQEEMCHLLQKQVTDSIRYRYKSDKRDFVVE